MKVSFLKNRSKFYVYFKNAKKIRRNVFSFQDNCGWTYRGKFPLLWQEYLPSAVNMLPNGPKISDPSRSHDTHFNFSHINKKLPKKCCRADFRSFSGHLTRWFMKGLLKEDLPNIQVTTFSNLNNFRSLFSKPSKFYVYSKTAKKIAINVFGFQDNYGLICRGKFSQLWQEY